MEDLRGNTAWVEKNHENAEQPQQNVHGGVGLVKRTMVASAHGKVPVEARLVVKKARGGTIAELPKIENSWLIRSLGRRETTTVEHYSSVAKAFLFENVWSEN